MKDFNIWIAGTVAFCTAAIVFLLCCLLAYAAVV